MAHDCTRRRWKWTRRRGRLMSFTRGGSSWNKKRTESGQARKHFCLRAFYRAAIPAAGSSRGSPTFTACVRAVPEIPTLVIHAYRCHVIRTKGNFRIPADLDNAALAHNDLLQTSPVFAFPPHNLVPAPCLFNFL